MRTFSPCHPEAEPKDLLYSDGVKSKSRFFLTAFLRMTQRGPQIRTSAKACPFLAPLGSGGKPGRLDG